MSIAKIMVLALATVGASSLAWSEVGENWPIGLAEYQEKSGNCPANLPVASPSQTPGAPALSQQYKEFLHEQACRTNALRLALERTPEKLCPGVTPAAYLQCYEMTGNAMAKAGLLDLSSLKFLSTAPHGRFLADKELVANPMEATLQKMRLHWATLRILENRTTPDKLPLTDKAEVQKLKVGEKSLAKAWAEDRIKDWGQLFKLADRMIDTPQGLATVNAKTRLAVAKNELKKATDLWRKR